MRSETLDLARPVHRWIPVVLAVGWLGLACKSPSGPIDEGGSRVVVLGTTRLAATGQGVPTRPYAPNWGSWWAEPKAIQNPVSRGVTVSLLLPAGAGGRQLWWARAAAARIQQGNRYLKIAFGHASIRAIQYFPVIKAFYQKQRRRKPLVVARAIVAAELARIVYQVLTKREDSNGSFRGVPLQRRKTRQWPRLATPAV